MVVERYRWDGRVAFYSNSAKLPPMVCINGKKAMCPHVFIVPLHQIMGDPASKEKWDKEQNL